MKVDEHRKRTDYIIEQLLKHGYISVSEIASRLYVSAATVRRDLQLLEESGLVHRTHGGAVHVQPISEELLLYYRERETISLEQKRIIGRAAAALVREGETITLSGGSTTLQVAAHLPTFADLTVITNDLAHVRVLAEHKQLNIFVPGGFLRLGPDNLIGPNTIQAVQDFKIDRLFLTVTAADLVDGVSAGHIHNVLYLRELVALARVRILVADHTKFSRAPLLKICDWSDIDIVVTDVGIPAEYVAALRKHGVRLIIAQ